MFLVSIITLVEVLSIDDNHAIFEILRFKIPLCNTPVQDQKYNIFGVTEPILEKLAVTKNVLARFYGQFTWKRNITFNNHLITARGVFLDSTAHLKSHDILIHFSQQKNKEINFCKTNI